jgi:hypothetical protein
MAEEATSRIEGDTSRPGPAHSVDAVAERIGSLLEPERTTQKAAQPKPTDSPEGEPEDDRPEAKAPAVEAEAEEADEDQAESEDTTDAVDGAEEAESPDTLEDLARALGADTDEKVIEFAEALRDQLRVPVKVNGETKRVTLREALDGYSRTEDYRANNQTLLEARRQFDEAAQQVQTQWKTRLEQAEELSRVLYHEMAGENLDAILENEGAEAYLAAKARQERRQAAIQQAQTQADQARAESLRQFIASQRERMAQEFPEVTDPEKGPKLKERWSSYLKAEEFGDEEIAQLVDARMLRVINKAMKYDDLQKAKPERDKKLKVLPKVLKPGKGGQSKPKSQSQVARERLRRTGSPQDAAAALMDLIS